MQQGMQANAEDKALWQPYAENTTFRFDVFGYNHHMPASRQREIIESFKFMGFKGKIRLRDPQLRIAVMEDWPFSDNREGVNVLKGRRGIWIGRWVRVTSGSTDFPKGLQRSSVIVNGISSISLT